MDTDCGLCELGPHVLCVVQMNINLEMVTFIYILHWHHLVLSCIWFCRGSELVA